MLVEVLSGLKSIALEVAVGAPTLILARAYWERQIYRKGIDRFLKELPEQHMKTLRQANLVDKEGKLLPQPPKP